MLPLLLRGGVNVRDYKMKRQGCLPAGWQGLLNNEQEYDPDSYRESDHACQSLGGGHGTTGDDK